MGGVRPTVMLGFTQHNPSTCITHDDLEAIHTLYPDCLYSKVVEGRARSHPPALLAAPPPAPFCFRTPFVCTRVLSSAPNGNATPMAIPSACLAWQVEPVCNPFKPNLGTVRVAAYVLFPFMIILTFTMVVQSCIQHHQREELREARADKHEANQAVILAQMRQNVFKLGRAVRRGHADGAQTPRAAPRTARTPRQTPRYTSESAHCASAHTHTAAGAPRLFTGQLPQAQGIDPGYETTPRGQHFCESPRV